MKISKKTLFDEYGIDLKEGKYRIKNNCPNYSIYIVQDDSLGCVLVGENKVKGQVINSRNTLEALMKKLEGEEHIVLTII